MTSEANELENMTLSDLFDMGWKLEQEMEKASDESSDGYLLKRKKAIEIFRKCSYMLDELHLFSGNETLEEVSTSEIRYFLNDALLGWCVGKVNSSLSSIRLVALEEAKQSIIKYLKLTKSYSFHNYNMEKFQNDNHETRIEQISVNLADKQAAFDMNLLNQAYERNEKIKRFKEQKELESQLNLVQNKSLANIDEEHRRKLYTSFVKFWVNKSLDDLKIINDEINILSSIEMEKVNRAENSHKTTAPPSNQQPVKKPFIITRDALQAKVFGAGYPSLPVYSVEEFYDQLADKGMMPKHGAPSEESYAPVQIGKGVTENQKEKEKAEKDELEDRHDEDQLMSQRKWDEFTDENKRGAGNRFNKS